MGNKKIQKTLKILVKRVKKRYDPDKIILFGSYASGKASKNSDIDILVVADSYKKKSLFDRAVELHQLSADLEPDINFIAITPEEEKKPDTFPTIKRALKTGLVLSTKEYLHTLIPTYP